MRATKSEGFLERDLWAVRRIEDSAGRRQGKKGELREQRLDRGGARSASTEKNRRGWGRSLLDANRLAGALYVLKKIAFIASA